VPVCALLYRLLPKHLCTWGLLAACLYYYASWTPQALPILLGVTLVSYLGGRILQQHLAQKKAVKSVLACFLALTLACLLVCKYTAFFISCINQLLHHFGSGVSLTAPAFLLPIGISFFTLQAVSYLVDVASGKLPAEKNFLCYLLFMSFFPSVTSGPICRAPDLLPQFHTKQKADYRMIKHGCLQMLWGFFLKLVIADRIAPWVTFIYSDVHAYAGLPVWSAVLLYSFEIYADFAGYTHIALGAAELFGIRLPQNFNLPYLSLSMREFWRRWHISFSTWLRDYIYIPLGGSHCSKKRKYFNVMVTFAVSGFWHGAGLNFILWGLLHGFYQVAGGILTPVKEKINTLLHWKPQNKLRIVLSTLFTFCLVDFAWIFFRCGSVRQALSVIHAMTYSGGNSLMELVQAQFINGVPGFRLLLISILGVMILECLQHHYGRLYPKWLHWYPAAQWICVFALLMLVLVCGVYGPGFDAQSFIYAKF
jgi:D-alanyl-lipoteichoic acid acyltransferase DltB (MBOAT superfamily)